MIPSNMPTRDADPGKCVRSLAICVFCGSRPGLRPAISATARQLGELIGRRGHHLVYGGGGTGLMGEVAWSAWQNGATVTGYAPRFIYERELGIAVPQQTVHVTEDLFERKRCMIEHADAFITLPGGYGTLDELLTVLSMIHLRIGDKPLILLNTDGFWNGLVDLARSLYDAGFADQAPGDLLRCAGSPAEAIAMTEQVAAARIREPIWAAR
jgi:cytokinin riboside 5'-monophosphate phosphoribohydrolase